ncbi:MAG: hypothetical protein ACOCY7_00645 [Halodesulfurarchaeum sp.]
MGFPIEEKTHPDDGWAGNRRTGGLFWDEYRAIEIHAVEFHDGSDENGERHDGD